MAENRNRKCFRCKEPFVLTKEIIPKIIHCGTTYYHSECLKQKYEDNLNRAKSKSNIDKWTQKLNELPLEQEKSNDELYNILAKLDVLDFISDRYDMATIPRDVCTRLNSIYHGEFKNVRKPIPPIHLLDMWERRFKKLEYQRKLKEKGGSSFSSESAIYYDIAVLCNSYNGYLKWLEQEKMKEIETRKKKESSNYDSSIRDAIGSINTQSMQDKQAEKENNILDMLDDIF